MVFLEYLHVLVHAPQRIEALRVGLNVAECAVCRAHLLAHQRLHMALHR